jgi:hypothetical protein
MECKTEAKDGELSGRKAASKDDVDVSGTMARLAGASLMSKASSKVESCVRDAENIRSAASESKLDTDAKHESKEGAKSVDREEVHVGKAPTTKKTTLTAEEIQEEKVEAEFEEMMRKPNVATIAVSDDPKAKKVLSGFRICGMNMRDGITGKMIWEAGAWGTNMFEEEMNGRSDWFPMLHFLQPFSCVFVSQLASFSLLLCVICHLL